MIERSDLLQLRPAQRAELIYASARARTDDALWRTVMGGDPRQADPISPASRSRILELEAFLHTLAEDGPSTEATQPMAAVSSSSGASLNLGPNDQYAESLKAAAERTGLPPEALAAIVDAESAKKPDGSWNPLSRNPRSSAAGIGQFLSGTWIGEAERRGTWLHRVAADRGWLDGSGRVRPAARADLLALRYQPTAAIEAVADYATANLSRIRKAGIEIGDDPASIARVAYLGHHLGPGDAVRFLQGRLSDARAERLLNAQVGVADAARRIAAAGAASAAHRQWLTAYVDRHLRTDTFSA